MLENNIIDCNISIITNHSSKSGFYGKYTQNLIKECRSTFPNKAVGMGTPWVALAVRK